MTAPAAAQPTTVEESRQRIREALMNAKKVAVGTHAGEEVRVRMMHPGAFLPDDEQARPIIYLASMKNDPKVREMTTRPEVALLLHESPRSEEHTSELQSHSDLVCRLLLEKKKKLPRLLREREEKQSQKKRD